MKERFSKSALVVTALLLSSSKQIAYDNQLIMSAKPDICYMLNSARKDKKEMLMFFACNQRICRFVKSKARGQMYTIKINQDEMMRAFKHLKSILKSKQLNYGFAHTHPNYTIKKAILANFNCQKNLIDKVCAKLKRRLDAIKYLSVPPSVIDLNTQLYLISSYGAPLSSIVVDSYYAWFVYFKPNPYFAASPDEYTLMQNLYKQYEERIGKLLVSALKNSKNLAPNATPILNDAISRLSLHIEQIQVDDLCKK